MNGTLCTLAVFVALTLLISSIHGQYTDTD